MSLPRGEQGQGTAHARSKSADQPFVAPAIFLAGWVSEADAGCIVPPGTSKPIRLSHPGKFDLGVYCSAHGGATSLDGTQGYVAQSQFTYQAVLDRCYIEFGSQLFASELGRGFFGTQGTKPFTLNNPNQGDIILGPFQAACPVISRRG